MTGGRTARDGSTWATVSMLLTALVLGVPVGAEPAPGADEVKQRWQGRLDGRRFTAVVRLGVDRAGHDEERRLEVYRDDHDGRRERLMVRFRDPADLRDLGLLYLENEGGPNDYFLYQPALGRVRRVPETMVREDVYGVDLEYLGFGVALIEPTRVEEVRREELDGRAVVFLQETALRPNPRFDERRVWLDPETWIPLRTEHLRDGRIAMVARTGEIRPVQGVPTPATVVFERDGGTTVTMTVERVDYEAPVPDAFFSTLALIKR